MINLFITKKVDRTLRFCHSLIQLHSKRAILFVDRPPAGARFPNAPTLKKSDRTRRDRTRRPSIAEPALIYFAYRND
ncbi:hypothetical protein QT970_23805 [Microcoleus sp. herbarium8]|uniref:hypothetical protein n=1 Tax=Microcoleus sp. herbarium8 TaxID=3055436 RepID=UPI002FD08C0D